MTPLTSDRSKSISAIPNHPTDDLTLVRRSLIDRGAGGVLATDVGEIYYMDIDSQGRIFAADYLHGKLLVFDVDGTLLLELDQIDGLPGLDQLTGVAFDAGGNIWLTNEKYNYLAKVQIALPS